MSGAINLRQGAFIASCFRYIYIRRQAASVGMPDKVIHSFASTMRTFLPCLLLVLCAGCAKTSYEYAVVCDFITYYKGPTQLVVTNDAGNILKIFNLPDGTPSLHEKFEFEAKDGPDRYNLHWLKRDSLFHNSWVISRYGVRNGAAVSFWPVYSHDVISSVLDQRILIEGIEAVDSVDIPGVLTEYHAPVLYNAATKTAELDTEIDYKEANLLIRIRPQASAPFRSYLLPTAGLEPFITLKLQWADFLPETGFATCALPSNDQVDHLQIDAIEPDFKRYATLVYFERSKQPANTPSNQIPQLPGTYPETSFRVRVQQGDYTADQVFAPGAALVLEKPGLRILSAGLTNQRSMKTQIEGPSDMVEANIRIPSPDHADYAGQWQLLAPPEMYGHLVLPDLTGLIPGWLGPATQDVHFQLTAYQFERLDYNQLLAGFPWKGYDGRSFRVARSGVKMASKQF